MISDLFKSICHDAPKRIIKRNYLLESQYHDERERFEREQLEREQREHDDLMLFVRLVHDSRQ